MTSVVSDYEEQVIPGEGMRPVPKGERPPDGTGWFLSIVNRRTPKALHLFFTFYPDFDWEAAFRWYEGWDNSRPKQWVRWVLGIKKASA